MTLFVRERFLKPRDEIRMAPTRVRKLRRIDRHRAMLASVVYAQDAGDEAGWRARARMWHFHGRDPWCYARLRFVVRLPE